MTPEQRRAEYMDMIKAEKEAAEKERQEKMKQAICEGQGTSSGYVDMESRNKIWLIQIIFFFYIFI